MNKKSLHVDIMPPSGRWQQEE